MTRSTVSVWTRLVAFAGIGAAILLAGGCDSSGSKRDSQYQKLVGSWRVYEVSLSGGTVRPKEDTTRIEFLQREGARGAYRIIRVASNDTTGRGQIEVGRGNELRMTIGSDDLLVWNFEFDGSISVRFRLIGRTNDGSVEEFLTAIGLSGGTESLAVELLRN